MRRADRLFQIIQLLRRRRITTARDLAQELEVSERTVYRDIADLVASGVPIEGEAGVGYLLRPGFDLPPLMFTATEIEALVLGMRVVSSWTDPSLARAAETALERVEAALPERLRERLNATQLYAPGFHVSTDMLQRLGDIRQALEQHRKLQITYRDRAGVETERTVRPLGLFFWGTGWSLVAWCELRNDFRQFLLDRLVDMSTTDLPFADEDGKTLSDFIAKVENEEDN